MKYEQKDEMKLISLFINDMQIKFIWHVEKLCL